MASDKPTWKEYPIAATIHQPGSSTGQNTGDWRSERPIRHPEKCDKCGICWIFCPDAALFMNEEGFYEVDLYHCKGCGICVRECAKGAIEMVEESE